MSARRTRLNRGRTSKVVVDFNSCASIRSAERMKSKLENQGLALLSTKQSGFNKFILSYGEKKK